ncbi:unnamed protein product [Phytomonas sp. EM1]|nr:unnamed protein product [Phytomonas sp. EM1]|eukprot:CCW62764.1 unnamed protein product [Phytomonas sp. isolate EM1]
MSNGFRPFQPQETPTYKAITLEEAVRVEFLSKVFNQHSAANISRHLSDFFGYKNEFPSYFVRIISYQTGAVLEVVWNIRLNGIDPSRATIIIAIEFRDQFPMNDLKAFLRVSDPSKMCVKQPYNLISNDGSIQLDSLYALRGASRPYPIILILTTLKKQFEAEYPLVDIPGQVASNVQSCTMPNPSATTHSEQAKRHALIESVAEKVFINLNQKTSSYLDTRKQSLKYLEELRVKRNELEKAKADLMNHKQRLSEYLPNACDISSLLEQLNGHEDTIEEHAKCLIPGNELQARVLELVVDNLALDDMLGLLDDGLKSEKLSCEEYVKLITDLSREQFLARFAYQKIQPQVAPLQSMPAASSNPNTPGFPSMSRPPHEPAPSIPRRLSPEELLKLEFPNAEIGIIRDVLSNLNNDIKAAQAHLKSIFQ